MSLARGSEMTVTSKQSLAKKAEEDYKRRKSQAQRLLEFEMLTDSDKTLKDLEYSQRRTEKKQRRRDRRKNARNRCWQKLYVPAVVGMVGGAFLTLCASLHSLGGDTVLWDARGTLAVVGPLILALGFLCLMLAAACTFKHDQQLRQKPRTPPEDFLLLGVRFEDLDQLEARRAARGRGGGGGGGGGGGMVTWRSDSVDTMDMPMPDDLDPRQNFMAGVGMGVGVGGHGRCRLPGRRIAGRTTTARSSTSSTACLLPNASFNSTASWVQLVSESHGSPLSLLLRQNSDSNLLASSTTRRCGFCRGHALLGGGDEEEEGNVVTHYCCCGGSMLDSRGELEFQGVGGGGADQHGGSHCDMHVLCGRSLSSSGYHSAGDSPTTPTTTTTTATGYPSASSSSFRARNKYFDVKNVAPGSPTPGNNNNNNNNAAVAKTLFRMHCGGRRGSLDSAGIAKRGSIRGRGFRTFSADRRTSTTSGQFLVHKDEVSSEVTQKQRRRASRLTGETSRVKSRVVHERRGQDVSLWLSHKPGTSAGWTHIKEHVASGQCVQKSPRFQPSVSGRSTVRCTAV